ncbi:MAG: GNAT family N-acetyltransferase [Myxococcales bacterium]|nr:GNAT family N-acetyltransferase [Myxococcales bacterium]
MLGVEVIRTVGGLKALKGDWDALCDACAQTTPFQRPGWAIAWAAHLGVAAEVYAVREGRDLVGVLPGFVWGAPGARTLSILGAGPSDHLDAVAAPGREAPALEAIREAMASPGREWQAWAFDEIGPRALLRGLAPPERTAAVSERQSVCPVLAIAGDAAQAEDVIPAGQAARLRKARRRCAREAGTAGLQRADRGDFAGALRLAFGLHARRWADRDAPGSFADPRLVAVHEQAAADLARRRALRVYVLRVGDRPAAAVYGFRERQRLHLYAQGFDPAFEALSPGLLALGAVIDDAVEDGVREVDFLRGNEPYKYQWGAVDEENVRLTWERACAAGADADARPGRRALV